MRVMVVDDETPARDELIYLLKQHSDVDVVAEAEDAQSAIQLCRKEKPHVTFLDIHMPGNNGLKLARQLSELIAPPLVVFSTAYDQHAVEAFEVNAVDYLLKPFSEARVAESLEKLRKQLRTGKEAEHIMQQKIAVYYDEQIKLLNPEDIICASRQGRDVIVKTFADSYKINYSLQHLENRLAGHGFFRPHNSFLVNTNMIEKIEPWFSGHHLVMKDKEASQIPVSRSGMKQIRRFLGL